MAIHKLLFAGVAGVRRGRQRMLAQRKGRGFVGRRRLIPAGGAPDLQANICLPRLKGLAPIELSGVNRE